MQVISFRLVESQHITSTGEWQLLLFLFRSADFSSRFYQAANIFNAYIGLEALPLQPLTFGVSGLANESPDFRALWLWVKAHRAEVALLAEAQLNFQSSELQLSCSSLQMSANITGNTFESNVPTSSLCSTIQPKTSISPHRSKPAELSQNSFSQSMVQTPPTQQADLPLSSLTSPLLTLSKSSCEWSPFFTLYTPSILYFFV